MATNAPPILPPAPPPRAAVRELRLALVCYGGVSLAIYMHGVTRELHKLIRASAAYDRDQTKHAFAPDSSETVYWDVLHRIDRDGVGAALKGTRLRVVVEHHCRHVRGRHQRHLPRQGARAELLAGRAAGPVVQSRRHREARRRAQLAAGLFSGAPRRSALGHRGRRQRAPPRRRDVPLAP